MIGFPFPWLTDLSARPADRGPGAPSVAAPYAGDHAVEERIVAEVASFGRQLGIIAEAVLEIVDERQGEAVERLRSIVNRVETIKARHNRSLEARAEEAFGALIAADPVAADRLLSVLEQRLIPPVSPAPEETTG